MKILLSPAKTMNLDATFSSQIPWFEKESKHLRNYLSKMSISSLENFFNVSKETAKLTKSYYLNDSTYVAIQLFSGIAFKTFHQLETPKTLDDLYILSGLYGIIHALDGISPYRLDLSHPQKGSLIHFWKEKLYEYLKDEDSIISCMSQEYEVLLDQKLSVTYVSIFKNGKRAPSVDAKKVRGALANHLLRRKRPEGFNYDGYQYIKKDGHTIYIEK
jgi:cytoplasmic iron level regulating protein YaaA (DUF328/UPF0246 family)